MQQLQRIRLGLATFGMLALGCNDDGGRDDEVGEGSETTTSGSTSEDGGETSTTGSTTEAGDESADGSTDTATGTETTDTDTTTGEGGGEFTLIEAAFADEFGTLVLTFNDAVAPVDAVDPSDFRISLALTTSYTDEMGMLYEMSYYSDPNMYFDENAMPVGMTAIANGPNPDQLSLTLDGFDVDDCDGLALALGEADPEIMAQGHFFPHYAPGNIPVTSEGGVELPAIGPDWVLDADAYTSIPEPGWPNLHPQVAIPCPP